MPTEKLFLRIIAGAYGGRQLDTPPPQSTTTRPMLDRVKEALFDILARRIDGIRILDLCSGTGSLGLEALSRGAKHVTFVEGDGRNVKLIQGNIAKLGVEAKTSVLKGELPSILNRIHGPFELVLFDPPYRSELVEHVMPRLATKNYLVANAIIMIHRDRRSPPLKLANYEIDRRHRVGDSELWFLRFGTPGSGGKGDE
ncbi:MAG: 16S rRNA (guanine(966)-N(2))-methyltransferase RsmD [Pseudomonadota bacterium]